MEFTISRVQRDRVSEVEPPFDPGWDEFAKLQWHAAVASHDTGLTISVHDGALKQKRFGKWRPVPGMYGVSTANRFAGAMTYEQACSYLSGVEAGAKAARREGTNEPGL